METLKWACGQELRELRTERGLSQEALAHAAGRHRTYLSLVERGKSSPTLGTLHELVTVLGVSTSDFLRRVEHRMASG